MMAVAAGAIAGPGLWWTEPSSAGVDAAVLPAPATCAGLMNAAGRLVP